MQQAWLSHECWERAAVCEHSHFQAVPDADFEETWQDAGRAEDKVKKSRGNFSLGPGN